MLRLVHLLVLGNLPTLGLGLEMGVMPGVGEHDYERALEQSSATVCAVLVRGVPPKLPVLCSPKSFSHPLLRDEGSKSRTPGCQLVLCSSIHREQKQLQLPPCRTTSLPEELQAAESAVA